MVWHTAALELGRGADEGMKGKVVKPRLWSSLPEVMEEPPCDVLVDTGAPCDVLVDTGVSIGGGRRPLIDTGSE